MPLRRRPAERRIDAAIAALERHFPPDEATAPPSATWPAGFTAALDRMEFEAVTPIRLRFLASRTSNMWAFGLLMLVELALAGGILGIGPPPTAILISLIALIGWPFLFAGQDVAIERGSRSLIVCRGDAQLREADPGDAGR